MTTTKTSPRAAVYLRQSMDRDGDELAITRQREDCLKLCLDKGWAPIEFVDNDTSASSGKPRPAYTRMLADIERGRIQAVVAWDLDRLHRRPIELEHFITLADEKKLSLATVGGEADLSTDNGQLFARIKAAVARSEMDRKSARQKRAATQRAENGHPWWRSRPFGFDADPDPRTGKWSNAHPIREHPTEAKLLRAAYSAVLAGTELHRIAAAWNAGNITTPGTKPWTVSAVRVLLLNARNAGLREHHGTVIGKGTWPALVDEETWRSVVAKLTRPKRARISRGRKRLLSGIAVCGLCGEPMGSGITHTSGTLTYVCKSCGKVSRAADPVDEMVIEAVVQRLARTDAIELTRRDPVDTDTLRARRDGLRSQQKAAAKDFTDGKTSYEFASTVDASLAEQIAAIDAELTDSEKAYTYDGLIGVADVRAAFNALDLGRRRAVIAALVRVTVKPSGRGVRKARHEDVDIRFRGKR